MSDAIDTLNAAVEGRYVVEREHGERLAPYKVRPSPATAPGR